MWPPFVEQSIAMVRDHEHSYVRGPGYRKDDDGNVTERCAGSVSFELSFALVIGGRAARRGHLQLCCDVQAEVFAWHASARRAS